MTFPGSLHVVAIGNTYSVFIGLKLSKTSVRKIIIKRKYKQTLQANMPQQNTKQ